LFIQNYDTDKQVPKISKDQKSSEPSEK